MARTFSNHDNSPRRACASRLGSPPSPISEARRSQAASRARRRRRNSSAQLREWNQRCWPPSRKRSTRCWQSGSRHGIRVPSGFEGWAKKLKLAASLTGNRAQTRGTPARLVISLTFQCAAWVRQVYWSQTSLTLRCDTAYPMAYGSVRLRRRTKTRDQKWREAPAGSTAGTSLRRLVGVPGQERLRGHRCVQVSPTAPTLATHGWWS